MTDADNDVVWRLAMRWLTVPDVGSASCVCKSWNEMLTPNQEGGDLWKQICFNTHGRRTIEAMIHAARSTKKLDFHHVCKQFIDPRPTEISLRPTLSLDDIFVVVELLGEEIISAPDGSTKKRIVVPWSWTIDKSPWQEYANSDDTDWESGVIFIRVSRDGHFHVKNPFHSSSWEGNNFPQDRLEGLVDYTNDLSRLGGSLSCLYTKLRLTIFRRDNMKSVCLVLDRIDSDLVDDLAYFQTRLQFQAPECSARAWNAIDAPLTKHQPIMRCHLDIVPCEGASTRNLLRQAVRDSEARRTLTNKESFQVKVREFDVFIGVDDYDAVQTSDNVACVLEALHWR